MALATDRLIVALISEADGTEDCVTRWTGRSASRPAMSWRGSTVAAARVILTLTDREPSPGEHALHICVRSSGCLSWRHLYWGSPRDNALDARWGAVVPIRASRADRTDSELFEELYWSRAGCFVLTCQRGGRLRY